MRVADDILDWFYFRIEETMHGKVFSLPSPHTLKDNMSTQGETRIFHMYKYIFTFQMQLSYVRVDIQFLCVYLSFSTRLTAVVSLSISTKHQPPE